MMTTRYKIEDTTIYYQLCEARRVEGLEREHVPLSSPRSDE
jgi:hypothetical protein